MGTASAPILIVGAGLSGLCAALHLHQAGQPVLVLEDSDAVGGRIRTDNVDGFLLDRGFQVLLTAYPQVQQMLDLPALNLQPFTPGALSYFKGRLHPVRDPFRQPAELLGALFSPVGTFSDKIRVGMLRLACLGAEEKLLKNYNRTDHSFNQKGSPVTTLATRAYLKRFGFSKKMITRFFEPFLGGVFLDPTLSLPADYFRFLFGCFAVGEVALPAQGMQAIPDQLAARLSPGSLWLNTPVSQVGTDQVTLADGRVLDAKAVILATDALAAARLLGVPAASGPPHYRSTQCLYFSAPQAPVNMPILVLNGEGSTAGPINTLCVPSRVAAGYAPEGQHLVSVSVIGEVVSQPEAALREQVVTQAQGWFGAQVLDWKPLHTYSISQALPFTGASEALLAAAGQANVTLCGDYSPGLAFSPSIQGAMLSGQKAAERILRSLLPEGQD